MYEKFGQFIDGKWQQSSSGETYEVINPATEEIIGKASKANSTDIQNALKSAQRGLEIWRNTSPWERSKIIRRISELMRKKVDTLSKWLTLEVGKPLSEGAGEVGGAADIFEWNSEETKRIFGEINQSRFPNTKIHVIYQPVGVVAALVPWNFPVILASRKISTALAAGCSVIVKPDVITPGSVMEIVNICKEAGVPPGVVNLLSGDPAAISSELIKSDIIKKISITGSTRVGKLILKQAADKVQRVTMELSGHSPFIVFDDVDLNKVTDMAITAKFRNNGQVCISPNRFYIHEKKKDEFADLMVKKTKQLKMGWIKILYLVLCVLKNV
jgi:succinate-semialdehyde dehydrogenase/glutarate-semialdehyde dehydrogenase